MVDRALWKFMAQIQASCVGAAIGKWKPYLGKSWNSIAGGLGRLSGGLRVVLEGRGKDSEWLGRWLVEEMLTGLGVPPPLAA